MTTAARPTNRTCESFAARITKSCSKFGKIRLTADVTFPRCWYQDTLRAWLTLMAALMTFGTKQKDITRNVTKFWKFSPRFDMVDMEGNRMPHTISYTAILTTVFFSFLDRLDKVSVFLRDIQSLAFRSAPLFTSFFLRTTAAMALPFTNGFATGDTLPKVSLIIPPPNFTCATLTSIRPNRPDSFTTINTNLCAAALTGSHYDSL